MSGKRTRSFKCAVHHRDREVCSENDFQLVLHEPPLFQKMVHAVAMEILPEERDRKYYADRYTCCPPPVFIILVTIVEVGSEPISFFFLFYSKWFAFLARIFCLPHDGHRWGCSKGAHSIGLNVHIPSRQAPWDLALLVLHGAPRRMAPPRIQCCRSVGIWPAAGNGPWLHEDSLHLLLWRARG